MSEIDPSNLVLISATICCFGALYTDFPALIGCSGKEECLCIEEQFCAKLGTDPMPVSFTTGEGYWCKLSLFCCSCGLKPPAVLCQGKGQCFCCVNAASCPPNDDVPMMCGICFLALYPHFGFFKKVSEVK
eukprot:gene34459-41715_t